MSLKRRRVKRRLTDGYENSRLLTDGYENKHRLTDACGHICKKKYILVIFGKFKKRNPRAIRFLRRILDRNVVVPVSGVSLHCFQKRSTLDSFP